MNNNTSIEELEKIHNKMINHYEIEIIRTFLKGILTGVVISLIFTITLKLLYGGLKT